jgi:hypothetical protein
MYTPQLELDDIQGDLLVGMQKNAELFLFFKITDVPRFKALAREYIVGQLTSAWRTLDRERIAWERKQRHERSAERWLGLNLGFTGDGMSQLLGSQRPRMDPAFERGAAHPDTFAGLNDRPPSRWVPDFVSDRIAGVFLVAGPDPAFVTYHGTSLRQRLAPAVKVVYSEMGTVRPGTEKGREHFGLQGQHLTTGHPRRDAGVVPQHRSRPGTSRPAAGLAGRVAVKRRSSRARTRSLSPRSTNCEPHGLAASACSPCGTTCPVLTG